MTAIETLNLTGWGEICWGFGFFFLLLIFHLGFNHGTVELLILKLQKCWKSVGRKKNSITALKLSNTFIFAECSWWHNLLADPVQVTYADGFEEKTQQQR